MAVLKHRQRQRKLKEKGKAEVIVRDDEEGSPPNR